MEREGFGGLGDGEIGLSLANLDSRTGDKIHCYK
jgi:hypothetical protein